jgi:hypothetical protein
MTLTATICSGFEAIAAALAGVTASPRPAPAEDTSEFEFYTLDVAFTPYGPEIVHLWIPAGVESHTHSEVKKGDLV